MFKTNRCLGAIMIAGALVLSATATHADGAQSRRAPTYDVRPAAVPKGPAPSTPVMVGRTIVDGSANVKVKVKGVATPVLIGESKEGYIVAAQENRRGSTLFHVWPDGTKKALIRRGFDAYAADVAANGQSVAIARIQTNKRTRIARIDLPSGAVTNLTTVRGYANLLDHQGNRFLLATQARTFIWNAKTGKKRTIVRGGDTYFGDLNGGYFAAFDRDPYSGGCSTLYHLRSLEQVWRSCTQRVIASAPSGSRIATTHKLSDGPGMTRVDLRLVTGRRLASFEPGKGGSKGGIVDVTFEEDDDLLLDVYGPKKQAWVRGNPDTVNRATPLRPAPAY